MSDTVRVFVGTASNQEDVESQAVLEYTLRSRSSLPVEIIWMKQSHDPASPFYVGTGGWDTSRWTTPFSGFRWAIPCLCNYQGRAIYTDSDLIFRADIAELWNTPMRDGRCVVAKGGSSAWRFCVSLWDCERAKAHVLPLIGLYSAGAHKEMTLKFRNAPWLQAFEPDQNWNCLDLENYRIDDPRVKAIHYTAISTQPHLRWAIPRLERAGLKHWFEGTVKPHHRDDLIRLFDAEFIAAVKAGYPIERYITDEPFGPYDKASTKNYTRTSQSTAGGLS